MAVTDCDKLSTYINQRTLNFVKEMTHDRQPYHMAYANVYPQDTWDNFTGTLHTFDRMHVTRFNDDGCWTRMDETNCEMAICDATPKYAGWGQTRADFAKYMNEWRSPVLCITQWDHYREAKQAISNIVKGLKMEGPVVYSDFMRLWSIRTAGTLHVINSGSDPSAPITDVTLSDSSFTNNCRTLETGLTNDQVNGIGQISMALLQRLVNPLMMNGYFDQTWMPGGMISMFTDVVTVNKLVNENPALFGRYEKKDFAKGGAFYAYGAMDAAGQYAFKPDMTPLRFRHVGDGVFQRIFPWENVAATVGKKPQYSSAYENATYQLYHIVNPAARKVFGGSIEQLNPEMPFLTRNVMGKWTWVRPMANFNGTDPCTGTVCEYDGTKGDKGYWRMEHQLGVQTLYPEIEYWILAARQPQLVAPNPICGSPSQAFNYYTYPYNCLCETEA